MTEMNRDIESEVYLLRQKNLELKKSLNESEDKSRKLGTKVQRLTEDLKKSREVHGESSKSVIKEIHNQDMFEDLKEQIRDLSKNNSTLKNKLMQYKTQQEAGSRKKTPFDKFDPKAFRRLVPSVSSHKVRSNVKKEMNVNDAEKLRLNHEEIMKLQAMNNMLREKLEETEKDSELAQKELIELRTMRTSEVESALVNSDVERIALQKEVQVKNDEIADLRKKIQEIHDKFRSSESLAKRSQLDIDDLKSVIEHERELRRDLEQKLLSAGSNTSGNDDVSEIIKDLKEEKALLQKELDNLVQLTSKSKVLEDHQKEIHLLNEQINSLKQEVEFTLQRERKMIDECSRLNDEIRSKNEHVQQKSASYFDLKAAFDDMKTKLDFLTKNGSIDLTEIEEALALVKLRKEKGLKGSLEFLEHSDDLLEDKKTYEALRHEHLLCVQEVDKLKRLLATQEKITQEYKNQISVFQKKVDIIRNEYENRLENSARTTDLQSSRIAHLEAKLLDLANGKINSDQYPLFGLPDEEMAALEKGQNILEICIKEAQLTPEGVQYLRLKSAEYADSHIFQMGKTLASSKSTDLLNPEHNLTSFMTFDFFDFTTQVTPLALGTNPLYNFSVKFKVEVDDFLLEYLSREKMFVEMWRNIGDDFASIGVSSINFRDLFELSILESSANQHADFYQGMTYRVPVCAKSEGKEILGHLSYSIKVQAPMSECIKAYKERTLALKILRDSQEKTSIPKVAEEELTKDSDLVDDVLSKSYLRNQLKIDLLRLENFKTPTQLKAIYVNFQLYKLGDFITDEMNVLHVHPRTETSINFDAHIEVPVVISIEFDRYLRTTNLEIEFYGDAFEDAIENDVIYLGKCDIPLMPLSLGENIRSTFTIENGNNNKLGELVLHLSWNEPYKLQIAPIATQKRIEKTIANIPDDEGARNLIDDGKMKEENKYKQDNEAMTSDDAKSLNTLDVATINLKNLIFSPLSERTKNWILEELLVQQVFVSFVFADLPPQELETKSMVFDKNSFDQDLHMNFTVNLPDGLEDWIKKQPLIKFYVVSEPPQNSPSSDCIDFAVGTLNLLQVVKKEHSVPLYLNRDEVHVPADIDSSKSIGNLRIDLCNFPYITLNTTEDVHENVHFTKSPEIPPDGQSIGLTLSSSLRSLPLSNSYAKLNGTVKEMQNGDTTHQDDINNDSDDASENSMDAVMKTVFDAETGKNDE